MSGMLSALKSDLLGRRLLPLVALAVVALAGAVAYAVLGGSSGSSAPAVSATAPSPSAAGASLASPAPASTAKAVAETTSGMKDQRIGKARNPFIPLPSPAQKAPAQKASSGASSSSGPSSSSGSGGGTAPSAPQKPAPAPAKPKQPVYQVAVLFGKLPAAGENPSLTPYEDLKRLTPLPSAKQGLIVFAGVSRGGKGAVFELLREAILKGTGRCLPSATQCEAIELQPGKAEELDYLAANGESVPYELELVSIAKREDSSAAGKRAAARVSRAGRKLLRRSALGVSARLRYVPVSDVVLYTAPRGG